MQTSKKVRRLGQAGPGVFAQGLGCMGMSEFYGPTDEAESRATLLKALELGVNFFDTSDMYGRGHNEELVGSVLNEWSGEVILATKFGIVREAAGYGRSVNGRPEYVKAAAERSLQRLNRPVIDLYYQHRVDPDVPIEETVGAMARLVEEGKVLHLGLSEAGAGTIRRAHRIHPIAALQTEYSLCTRDLEEEILPTLRELGIALVPYSPLGRGFLSGKMAAPEELSDLDFRKRYAPRFKKKNYEHNQILLKPLHELAEAKGATAAQIALAWVLHQGDDIIPIPGTRREKYLRDNLAACDIELTPEEIKLLGDTFVPGAVRGERYAPAGMAGLSL